MGRKQEKRTRNVAANRTSMFSFDKKTVALGVLFFGVLVALMRHFDPSASALADNKLPVVDVLDTVALKEIFLSGNPHIVHCVSNSTQDTKTPKKLNELVGEFKTVKMARINCWYPTASGKTLSERFKIPRLDPVTVTVANLMAPQVLKLKGGPDKIKKAVAKNIKPSAVPIRALKDWNSQCRSRKQCLVISSKKQGVRDKAENDLRPLMANNRALRVVSIDSGFWQVKLEESLLETKPEKDGSDANVVCIVKTEGGVIRAAFMSSWEGDIPKEFVKLCASGGDASWPEQFDAVEIMVRETPEEKTKVVEPPPTNEDSAKKDRVGSREKMEETEDDDTYYTPPEKKDEDEDDDDVEEIEM
eukprot:GEMP01047357.1.p1 GENE.GEMP01047357.1~~GEMP01047357.1.p1  ORF type:complete len:370 (+),score=118.88 GEMP01047357.1:33-1112(+)